ncbi:hypothetical protein PM3016_2863 [Paenibacillus mucilaginosus 3016]|uniref:DUF962 domain-containing protein n=1 Tax=Paenibacillus mucilaginosus 3016 TaxID=1116391 RepID=H6NL30_9BACL|nr:DUF962 domain-containing protein [Paenibacillus mucilaginosus]AFC29737.1 hypothetical protein PM3016_2863 [Paenibacillus mucilaginosus 3016]WFA18409.1 DUF962 domain-containing protein [Paenibacillus mucilaginosus]
MRRIPSLRKGHRVSVPGIPAAHKETDVPAGSPAARVKADVVRYLRAHRHPWNLRLHYGAFLAAFFGWIFLFFDWRMTLVFAAAHYILSWTGHFGFEKNKPASFRHPMLGFYAGFAWFFVRTYELGTGRSVLRHWEKEAAGLVDMQEKGEELI